MTNLKTKGGMVSFYLVVFVTMLLSIIAVSFYWIMRSESEIASNSDLSQSAYDAALAGIEDAKSVLSVYNSCKSKSGTAKVNGYTCSDFIRRVENGFTSGTCDTIATAYSTTRSSDEGEVAIQESVGAGGANALDQAYTCVKIDVHNLASYRSALSAEEPSRMIPINTDDSSVRGIQLQWFSKSLYSKNSQLQDLNYMYGRSGAVSQFKDYTEASKSVPILSFELFQPERSYKLYELDVNNPNNSGADHVMAILYPQKQTANRYGSVTNTFVSGQTLLDASNMTPFTGRSNSTYDSSPVIVNCGHSDGYLCRVNIEFPPTYRGGQRDLTNTFIRVMLPYGTPSTDFEVSLCQSFDSSGTCVNNGRATFNNVQAIVDSTGRANTLYRRLVAYVDLMATGNYINNAVQIYEGSGGSSGSILKNFYSTENCQLYEDGVKKNCNNNNKSD